MASEAARRTGDPDDRRRLRLRYPAVCSVCRIELSPKTEAFWDRAAKQATCLACGGDADVACEAQGVAGGLALSRARSLADGAAEAARELYGDHAAVVAEKMAIQRGDGLSWAKGGAGESRLAAWIEREVGDAVIPLHDRTIPGLRGANIDHLFVASTGVWVVDTKAYAGRLEQRDVGPLWRAEYELYVGGRNRTNLVDGLTPQLQAVRAALEPDLAYEQIPIRPTLCFVESDWNLLQRPFAIRGVTVLYPGALRSRLRKSGPLSHGAMERVANRLALSLPPNTTPREPGKGRRR